MAMRFEDYQRRLHTIVVESTASLLPSNADALSSAVTANVHFETEGPQLYHVQVCHHGVTAIRYNVTSALGAAVALVGGIAGANVVGASSAVLGCFFALQGWKRQATPTEALALLALKSLGGSGAHAAVTECMRGLGYTKSDEEARERLYELGQLGVIELRDDLATLKESVIVRFSDPDAKD